MFKNILRNYSIFRFNIKINSSFLYLLFNILEVYYNILILIVPIKSINRITRMVNDYNIIRNLKTSYDR